MTEFNFGFSSETKSGNKIPFDLPKKVDGGDTWEFPTAFLKSVTVDDKYETKKGEKTVLVFKFVDAKGDREHNHIEWAFEANDPKASGKLEAMNVRFAHIYKEYASLPEKGIGTNAKSFADFFKKVAIAFNEGGEEKTPIYSNKGNLIPVWLKVVLNRNNRQLPYSPNFIQRKVDGATCNLRVNLKYDKVEQESDNMGNLAMGSNLGGGAAMNVDDLPTFE